MTKDQEIDYLRQKCQILETHVSNLERIFNNLNDNINKTINAVSYSNSNDYLDNGEALCAKIEALSKEPQDEQTNKDNSPLLGKS